MESNVDGNTIDSKLSINLATKSAGSREIFFINSLGYVGILSSSPTAPLDISGNTIRLRNSKTPSSSSDTGNAGDICWDSNYIYICVSTNTWKRVAISTW